MLFLLLYVFCYGAFHVESKLALCSRAFFSPVQHCAHLAWGRDNWSICFSCLCLFILHVLISVFFSSSWRQWLVVACNCGTPWTSLLTCWYHICFVIPYHITVSGKYVMLSTVYRLIKVPIHEILFVTGRVKSPGFHFFKKDWLFFSIFHLAKKWG